MKVGIVGCNGQVGTELALIYQKMDIEVVPIVRSNWSASFLKHNGFKCRVGDINDSIDAKKLLENLENIIISVIISDFGGPSKNQGGNQGGNQWRSSRGHQGAGG